MNIRIIKVPYDCGYKDIRQGAGPDHFMRHNLDQLLETDGHQIKIADIEAKSTFTTEVGTAFELNRFLADVVQISIGEASFPIVLSGNCNSCLGTIAGIGSDELGVVWFDAHGEFNTPETTHSGYLDGMPLAMTTGRCWKTVANTIPGFTPVPESNVILIGAADLDKEEKRQLEQSEVRHVRTMQVDDAEIYRSIETALVKLQNCVTGIYLHIDMDSFKVDEGKANHYGAAGILTPASMIEAIALVKKYLTIQGCGIASYDPICDSKGKILEAGLRAIREIASGKD